MSKAELEEMLIELFDQINIYSDPYEALLINIEADILAGRVMETLDEYLNNK